MDHFREVDNPEKRLPPKTQYGVEHHIRVKDGLPISSKFRRVDPEKFAAAQVDFDQLERKVVREYSACSYWLKLSVARDEPINAKFGFSHWMKSPSVGLIFPVSYTFCL
jgi:hypothetical protein